MKNPTKIFGIAIAIMLALFVLVVAVESVFTVKGGTVGVVRRFGKVESIMEPGLNFKIPFVDDVIIYNTQMVIYETSDYPSDSLADYTDYSVDTTTEDGQSISIKYSIRFSVNPEKVMWIANNLGREQDIVEKIVKTDSRIHVRGYARNYAAADLYTGNIRQLEEEITNVLLPAFEQNGLILDEFGIRNIVFGAEYIEAIEQKQIEKEKVTTEKYIAEQEQYKKEAAITRAEAEAETQRLVQQTITSTLLQKMWIEKWNGQLPGVMTGDSQGIIIDLGNLQ
ncbi:prohibitin family protein [Candidatus Dojkabacteria bacterium]|nr:prohibitin family protein [Candidatus Dojkabacteria bacterium]